MSFSQRMGIIGEKSLQIEYIDPELKIGIWNTCTTIVFDQLLTDFTGRLYLNSDNDLFDRYARQLWARFYKERLDEMPVNVYETKDYISKKYFSFEFNQIYDFIEFNIKFLKENLKVLHPIFVNAINKTLEREFSGYRIAHDIVVPITNEIELKEIRQAIFNTSFSNVNLHLHKSLELLSDKVNPDFPNSIKESIMAVELVCREITSESTLGESIKVLEKNGVVINPQLKEALNKLYAYTNSKNSGIRHALVESPIPPKFEEANFFLVICSAFINYLSYKKFQK